MVPVKSFRNFLLTNPNRSWSGETYHISQNSSVSLPDKVGYINEFITHFQSRRNEYGQPIIEILGRDANTAYNRSVFNYSIIALIGAHIDELSIELPQNDPITYLEEIHTLNSAFLGAKEFRLDNFLNASVGVYHVDSSAPMSLRKKLLLDYIEKNRVFQLTFSQSVDGSSFNVVSAASRSLKLIIGLDRSANNSEASAFTSYFQQSIPAINLSEFKKHRTDSNEYTISAELPIEERKRILVNFFYALPQGGKSLFDEEAAVRLYVNVENILSLNFIVELSGENEEQREIERYYLKDIPARQIG